MNKKLQKKVDELSERVTEMAQSHMLDDMNDILAETEQYHTALADILEYDADDQDPEAVKEVAKEFLQSTLEMKAATIKAFDETIVKLAQLAK